MDQQEHDRFVRAAFDITLSKMLDLHTSERKHLLAWLRYMLSDKTRHGAPITREKRLKTSRRIADLYGEPRGFARNLRIILWERSMHPRELAVLLETTKAGRIFEYMAGTSRGGRRVATRIARALGLDEDELMPVKWRRP